MDTYTKALLCEPANTVDSNNTKFVYVFSSPNILPKHLQEFGERVNDNEVDSIINENRQIVNSPAMLTCAGPGNGDHVFLEAEKHFTCDSCSVCICNTCKIKVGEKKEDEKILCMKCYKENALLPYNISSIDEIANINKMKIQMQEEGIDLPPHATVLEIEEIYESCIIHKQISTHKNLSTTVPFPILSSEVLDNGSLGETICDIDLSHGASFINDSQSIKNKHLLGIISLFAAFVSYKNVRYTAYHHPIYEAVPTMLVNFANGSRVNSGFRLLHRCRRHVLDTKAHDLTKTNATLFLSSDDGNIGIILSNKVPASMKNDLYEVKVACTENKLLACKCDCTSGGEKNCAG